MKVVTQFSLCGFLALGLCACGDGPASAGGDAPEQPRAPVWTSEATLEERPYADAPPDPEDALRAMEDEFVRLHHAGGDQMSARLDALLQKDEDEALRLLRKMTSEVNYDALGYTLMEHYKNGGRLAEGLDALASLSENITLVAPLLSHFVDASWAEDSERTLDWVFQNGETPGIENAMHLVGIRIGGLENPREMAYQVLDSQLSELVQSNFLRGMVYEWVLADFPAAFEFMTELPPSEMTDRTIYRLAGKAAARDTETAMALVQTIVDEGLRRSATAEVGKVWAETDPEALAEWSARQATEQDAQRGKDREVPLREETEP